MSPYRKGKFRFGRANRPRVRTTYRHASREVRWRPGSPRLASPACRPGRSNGPIPNSPQVDHQWPRMVRGRCPEPVSNHGVGNGGQGRNRTIDRGFSVARRGRFGAGKPQKREVFSRSRPNRPPRPSPCRTPRGPADRTPVGGPCGSTSWAHRDRTASEPRAERAAARPGPFELPIAA